MSEYFIHNSFFKKNPLKKVSAAVIADFSLTTEFNDELQAEMERIVLEQTGEERRARLEQDRAVIEALDSGEAIVKYMRQEHDMLANPMFCKKVLTMESEAAPLIVKRFMTSGQDGFIELAFRVLAKADKKYAEQLFSDYKNIRNPYAQAVACLLFAEHEMDDAPPLLMEEYRRFQQDYPDESFDQFPLLGLNIMYGNA